MTRAAGGALIDRTLGAHRVDVTHSCVGGVAAA